MNSWGLSWATFIGIFVQTSGETSSRLWHGPSDTFTVTISQHFHEWDGSEQSSAVLSCGLISRSRRPATLRLRDLLQCRESDGDFLSALTAFDNMELAGRCPSKAARFFSLEADSWHLRKKQAGSAPSPFGFTLRQLQSVPCTCAASRLSSHFCPR